MLEQRELDIVITSSDIQNGNIDWYPLYNERCGVLMSKQNPLASAPVLEIKDLMSQKFFIRYANSEEMSRLEAICHQAGFKPNICFSANSEDLALEHIARNEGIALAEQPVGMDASGAYGLIPLNDGLIFRSFTYEACFYQSGYAVLKNRYYTKTMRQFIACLRKYRTG